MKWEYKIIDDAEGVNPDAEESLNFLGEEGWELCAILEYPVYRGSPLLHLGNWRKWYFKRQVLESVSTKNWTENGE